MSSDWSKGFNSFFLSRSTIGSCVYLEQKKYDDGKQLRGRVIEGGDVCYSPRIGLSHPFKIIQYFLQDK
jgi:hypothetical protein